MNKDKELERRREEPYVVSPWALTWDDENYYLIAYDEAADSIKHFRVDKLKSIRILDKTRAGKERFSEFNLAKYSKMSFGMFGGKPTRVRIAFCDELAGVFIDRFGKNITIRPSKKTGWSETSVDVAVSDHFLGWVFALGSQVKIMGPDDVVTAFQRKLKEMLGVYEKI